MPESTPLDLAHTAGWLGITPGLTRAAVTELLAAQGIEAVAYGEDQLTASGEDEWEMELHFATDGSERLRQVALEGGDLRWNGRPLMDARLDDALNALAPYGTALWTKHDAMAGPFPDDDAATAAAPSDESLVEEGTVWLPERGLGIAFCSGVLYGVVRRSPEELPAQYVGPVTEAQRELSQRPDLEEHLQKVRLARYHAEKPREPFARLRTLVTVAAIAGIGWIAKSGMETTRQWAQADVLQAKLVAVERVPMKQFREFVPPAMRWIFPHQKDVIIEAYRVAYTAPYGRPGEVLLERGELYVPPEGLGAEVPVAYLQSDPPRVKGLSRARDAAFLEHVPPAIAVGVLYLVAQLLITALPTLLRFIRRFSTGR